MASHILIRSNVTLLSGRNAIEGTNPFVFERKTSPLPMKIKDDAWIAGGSAILPTITLRKRAGVGANAVVTKDTEEYAVVVGAHARTIQNRLPTDVSPSQEAIV